MRETDKKTKDKSKHKFRWSLLQRKSGQEKGGGGGAIGKVLLNPTTSVPSPPSLEWCTFHGVEEFTIPRCPRLFLPIPAKSNQPLVL